MAKMSNVIIVQFLIRVTEYNWLNLILYSELKNLKPESKTNKPAVKRYVVMVNLICTVIVSIVKVHLICVSVN